MVFDTSERRAFEAKLIAEVADSVSLPEKNVSIEEVRLQIHLIHCLVCS